MVPFGYPFNWELYDKLKAGDYIHFKDEKRFRVKAAHSIYIQSPIAECMAQMIYGKSMREVFQDFKNRYNRDIQDEKVMIIIYEAKEIKL